MDILADVILARSAVERWAKTASQQVSDAIRRGVQVSKSKEYKAVQNKDGSLLLYIELQDAQRIDIRVGSDEWTWKSALEAEFAQHIA